MVTYTWNPEVDKSLFKGKDPDKVLNEICSISDNPTKEQIVEKARDVNSEMHDLFEWNDTVAAEKYRLTQASALVRNLRVRYIGLNEDKPQEEMKSIMCRALYSLPGTTGYTHINVIMNDEVKYQTLLEQARNELERFKAKYAMLTELKPIFDLIQ